MKDLWDYFIAYAVPYRVYWWWEEHVFIPLWWQPRYNRQQRRKLE